MESPAPIRCLRLYPLAIPLRRPFKHARHVRTEADPIVVEVELADGTLGYGETLPRAYVSGETVNTVIDTIRGTLLSQLVDWRPVNFPEALECIEALPFRDETGRIITAARAGVELALLDAYSRHFARPMAEAVGWCGFPGFGLPGSLKHVTYSAVLSGSTQAKLKRATRIMRWFGLRDFKLKVGYEDDVERIRLVAGLLKRSLGSRVTLRLDANGGWTLQRAVEVLHAVRDLPLRCVEQPFARGDEVSLVGLKQAVELPVMHDESLITIDDAERLHELGLADGLDIRLSKNGGFLPSLRLAHFARKRGLMLQLGCMVGETSILSAAGRQFLANVPGVAFAEGSYGRFLLRGDVAGREVRFGYGGRPKPLAGPGWGVEVNPERLRQYVRPGVIELAL